MSKRAREEALLVRELAHRSRNTFAVAQAIVSLSLADNRAMAAAINQRFAALFATNQLLTNSGDQMASIKDIINAELECYGTKRIRASGPEVVLTRGPRSSLRADYPRTWNECGQVWGTVIAQWRRHHQLGMANKVGSFTWAESGGPATTQPSKVGFGTTLITSLLTPFDGCATLDFRPGGLECHATFSVKQT